MTDTLTALIRNVDQADSASALFQAVQALASAQDVGAIPVLIQVLAYNNPGAAVAAVDGLIRLGEAAVPALLTQLDGYNYGARAWAIRALALIGDPRALDILLETAQGDFALSARRAAAKGLGTLQWAKLSDDERESAQAQAQSTLIGCTADPEWVVRYAAIVGLQSLALSREPGCLTLFQTIQDHLYEVARRDEVLAVRARAYLAGQMLVRNAQTAYALS